MIFNVLSFCFLGLSILSLWLSRFSVLPLLLFIWAIGMGLLGGTLPPQNLAYLFIFAIFCWIYYFHKGRTTLRYVSAAGIFLIGFLFMKHLYFSFQPWPAFVNFSLGPQSQLYSLYLNYEKPAVGFFLIFFGIPLIRSGRDLFLAFVESLRYYFPTVIVLLLPALLSGYIALEAKLPAITPIWMLVNLLFVCVAEECFFRGFIQKELSHFLYPRPYHEWWALIISAFCFGLIHWKPGGWAYFFLSIIAGLLYGQIYRKSGRIESSILLHFLVNLTHFLFFTYPAKLQPLP